MGAAQGEPPRDPRGWLGQDDHGHTRDGRGAHPQPASRGHQDAHCVPAERPRGVARDGAGVDHAWRAGAHGVQAGGADHRGRRARERDHHDARDARGRLQDLCVRGNGARGSEEATHAALQARRRPEEHEAA